MQESPLFVISLPVVSDARGQPSSENIKWKIPEINNPQVLNGMSLLVAWWGPARSSPIRRGRDLPLVVPQPWVTELSSVLSGRLSQHHSAGVQVTLFSLITVPETQEERCWQSGYTKEKPESVLRVERWEQCIEIFEKDERPHSHSFYHSTLYFSYFTIVVVDLYGT